MSEAWYGKDGHAITIAPAGSGKTTCLVIPNLMMYEGPAFVPDTKGDVTATTWQERERRGRNVRVVNAWKMHAEPPWNVPQDPLNILDDLDPKSLSFFDDCDFIASLLIARTARDGGNTTYFKNDAQQKLGRGYTAFAKLHEPPARQSLLTVHEYVSFSGKREDELWDAMIACGNAVIAAEAEDLAAMYENAPQQFTAVKATMKEATNWLGSAGVRQTLGSSGFSLSALKEGDTDVYVIVPPEYQHTHAGFVRLLTGWGLRTMMRPPYAKEQVLFLLDEAAAMGRLALLSSGMAQLRGYNAFLWPFFQNFGQMREAYGEEAQTLIANAAVRIFMSVQDFETARLVSEMAGRSTLVINETDHRGNPVKTYRPRELITPDEVLRLPSDQAIAFVQNNPPYRLKKVPYWEKFSSRRYQPNPLRTSR